MKIYIVSHAYELTGDSESPRAFTSREKALAYLMEKAAQEMDDIRELLLIEELDRPDEDILMGVEEKGSYYYYDSDTYGYRWISEIEVD
jgi:hypothetical protein